MHTSRPQSAVPEAQPPKDHVAAFRAELEELVGETPPPSKSVVTKADFMPAISEIAQLYIHSAHSRHPSSGNVMPPTKQP